MKFKRTIHAGRPWRRLVRVDVMAEADSTVRSGLTDDEAARHRAHPRSPAQPSRTGHVRRHVVRALLVQVVTRAPRAGCRRRRRGCSSARVRTPAWSTWATASPPPSASRATTTRRPSSRTRARRRASAASCATSSRWAPGPSPSWTRCASARSTTPAAAGSPKAWCRGISGYGNAVGVPTVGGEVVFDADLSRQPARQRAVPRAAPDRPPRARPGHAARATWPCCSARPPAATASAA